MAEKEQKQGKKIIITAGSQDLVFFVTIGAYEMLQNKIEATNKVVPAKNFLRDCISEESKQLLEEFISQGLTLDLSGLVSNGFRPAVTLSLKK